MKNSQVDLCGDIGFIRDDTMPDLARDQLFSFACNGCGDCCRGREDIVLSGYDLYRISKYLRLPPRVVASVFCSSYIGKESNLPVLRLISQKNIRKSCPFLFKNRCSIHEAKPLACALYPLAQEINRQGEISYFLQPVTCGGQVWQARVQDYLSGLGISERETTDVFWALSCMELEEQAEKWNRELEPVLLRRLYQNLTEALYYNYNWEKPFRPQLEVNLNCFHTQKEKLLQLQCRRRSIEKTDR